jgi:nucleoside-diphosphate-sugar epimerase
VDVNVYVKLYLLDGSDAARVEAFVFVSTTSVFGDALTPPPGAPAAWIDEDVVPVPKNIYGATKAAGEDLVQLFHRNQGLPALVLRTSRFFPEADDDAGKRSAFADENLKTNELLHRRVDVEDIVDACRLALERAPAGGFRKCIVSATTPFTRDDLTALRTDASAVLDRRVPGWRSEYARRGWIPPHDLDRVYDNARARAELGWRPRYDFASVLERLARDEPRESPLAQAIGAKGYHAETFEHGPYPTG